MAIMKKPSKKYAAGGAVTTTNQTTKKPKGDTNPVSDYKNMVNPETGKKGQMGGEGTNPPLGGPKPKKGTKIFNGVTGKYDTVKKNGGTIKKAKAGAKIKKSVSKMKTCKGGC